MLWHRGTSTELFVGPLVAARVITAHIKEGHFRVLSSSPRLEEHGLLVVALGTCDSGSRQRRVGTQVSNHTGAKVVRGHDVVAENALGKRFPLEIATFTVEPQHGAVLVFPRIKPIIARGTKRTALVCLLDDVVVLQVFVHGRQAGRIRGVER